MKTIVVRISDVAHQWLDDASQRANVPVSELAKLAIEKAAYAAALARYAPTEGQPYRYDRAAIAEHDADVARIIYGDNP
ncbi:hypothetical protein [Glycomyces buryatensis]|uniref:Uncharacterized protein n=1 Tax=Glycomyces buryatensis TaxID=2570927 RepID=A0A4S8Q380_9ACTN|nr:hypothetical protein [Glycomyces buryatensis]THV34624.1 hypothetical protein FAB82_24065 [Glycomyces buryatensis]